jgi:predicted AlkP superfamily phosphohydrolase/phosphomutase
LERDVAAYIPDVSEFRTHDKHGLLARIHEHMENKFAIARHVMKRERWDFFMMVESGLDRLHHGFWRCCDPDHPQYEASNPHARAFEDYYKRLDEHIGELIALMGEDAGVMVVSDHGAKALYGAVAINEWLMREGYLHLKHHPATVSPLRLENIDWKRTRAWGVGGYCGRIEINLRDREPDGIVSPAAYESLRDELAVRMCAMRSPYGLPMGNRALKPESTYQAVHGVAPDLLVYFAELAFRAAGSVGHPEVFLRGNDTGPDECNHDFDGVFIAAGLGDRNVGHNVRIADVAALIARFFREQETTAR